MGTKSFRRKVVYLEAEGKESLVHKALIAFFWRRGNRSDQIFVVKGVTLGGLCTI